MHRFAWSEQVATLSAMLDTLGDRVTDGDPGATGLVEFKGALDDLRMRSWTLLMSSNSDDPHGIQEQFRTQRGAQMCRALTADLRSGKLSGHQPDLPALGAAARDLAAAVKEATPKPPKRRGKGVV